MYVNPPPFRACKYCAVLYPEEPTHAKAIEKLKTSGLMYAAILHDKEPMKHHWHVIITYAAWNTSLAETLGIEPKYLQQFSSLDCSMRYLLHDGNPEKHQYDIKEVFGPLKSRLAALTREASRVQNQEVLS